MFETFCEKIRGFRDIVEKRVISIYTALYNLQGLHVKMDTGNQKNGRFYLYGEVRIAVDAQKSVSQKLPLFTPYKE